LFTVYSIGPTGVGIITCLLAVAANVVIASVRSWRRTRPTEVGTVARLHARATNLTAAADRSWLRTKVAVRRRREQIPIGGVSPEARLFLEVLEGRVQREHRLRFGNSVQSG
jgi:hypothetical protein